MGFRSWRFSSQSSPNITEAVNKESYPLLQRNALTPWRDLRSRREEKERGTERLERTSPSLSSLACLDEPQQTKVALPCASSCLTRTLSIPDTSSTSTLSGFCSITITARRVSFSGDACHETRPFHSQEQLPSSSTSNVKSDCKATMVKMAEDSGRYYTSDGFSAHLAPPEHRHSCTDSGTTSQRLTSLSWREANEASSSSLVSKHLIFRSSAHLELLPCQPKSSTFYLDKSLSVPLESSQEVRQAMYRSTLSLHLGRAPSSSHTGKLQVMRIPIRSSSESDMVDFTRNATGEQSCCLKNTATVNSSPTRSDSSVLRATLAPLPFRARCRSSSAAVRLTGKANDVSGPLQCNQRGGVEDPEPAAINKRLDSLAVIRNSCAVVSVKCHGLEEKTQNSSHSEDAKGFSPSKRLLVNSGGSGRGSYDGRVPCGHAETVTKVQEGLVFPHMLNCTCGSNSSNQPHILSLKEALELFRPDFISRSQRRIRHLEQRARERRSLQGADLMKEIESTNKARSCTKPHPLSDNLFKPKDRVISGKEMQLRSRRIYNKLPEVTKKKEEEKRRLVLQTNRLRAEVFKKKLLDQILQRNSD
ncbi:uncharacterized protein LOC108436746 isoform X2 [Pygocentrus nattereri]|nr:uncharacterized protein LOC108436746 isoform X2 [Pygocentrus nattereri]